MAVSVIAGDFRTGRIRLRGLPVQSASCEVRLNAAGTVNAAFRLPAVDPYLGDALDPNIIGEGRSFLGYIQDGRLLNAGPIWSSAYDGTTKVWSLAAAGARSYLDYRFILPVLNDAAGQDLLPGKMVTYSNLSLRTIAKRLLQNAVAAYGGSFPVDFEDDFTDINTRTYEAVALKRVDDALNDLSNVLGGPDIMLEPYVTSDGNYVRWRLLTGTPELRVAARPWKYDTTVPVPSATAVSVARTAATLATNGYELGATPQTANTDDGSTAPTVQVSAKAVDNTLIGLGYPRLEASESRTDVSVLATLQGYADGLVQAGRYLTQTVGFKSRNDLAPLLRDIRVGDGASLVLANHPLLGTQELALRILGISASLAEPTSTISCAPVRVAAA